MFIQKASKDSPPMFENKFIDLFSRTHFLTVAIVYVPASLALLYYSWVSLGVSWWLTLALAAVGFVAWTLLEYWLHRTLFHWIPTARWGPRFHFFLHGVHHDWPNDKYRLVMPPAVSGALFFLFLGLSLLVFGTTYGWAFHAGLTIGYMNYDLTHYYLHHGKAKKGRMRRLRQHHIIHHFKKGHTGKFGVSTTVWDRVFRTLESRPVEPKEAKPAPQS
ncbi:MAG: sterol desaturase family protein [Myxococcota bacterium]